MENTELLTATSFFQEPLVQVFNYAMITALATGLGALPFFFHKEYLQWFFGQIKRPRGWTYAFGQFQPYF